jgi:DNA-binding MarR family transcriptional regulator
MKIFKLLNARRKFYEMYPDLGPKELELLEQVAIFEKSIYPLNITEAMQMGFTGSPASTHRYLDKLRAHDLLKIKKPNGRSKFLHLGTKGQKYFNSLEKLL